MFHVANLVLSSAGRWLRRFAFTWDASLAPQENWRYPYSLDHLLNWSETILVHLGWCQNPLNMLKCSDLHPKDHNINIITNASNTGWDAHWDRDSVKGLWWDREKGLHINILELNAVFLALKQFRDQWQKQTMLIATGNSTVVVYINKQERTHSGEMYAVLWGIMSWCYCHKTSLCTRHIPFNVIAL